MAFLPFALGRASDYQFHGKHVVVTGSASGIGLEVCKLLLARSIAGLYLLDNNVQALASSTEALRGLASSARILSYQVDVSDGAAVTQTFQSILQEAPSLDVVFANAGIGPGGRFLDQDPEHFKLLMDVNYMSAVHSLQAALPPMLKQKSGRIVVSNSIGGYLGIVGAPACSSSKWALRGLIESVRLELKHTGVKIHLANPPFVDTPMLRKSQASQPEAVRKIFAKTKAPILSPSSVAEKMIEAVEVGRYLVQTPKYEEDYMLRSCLSPSTERPNSFFWDMWLSYSYVINHWRYKWFVEPIALEFSALCEGKTAPQRSGWSLQQSMLWMAGLAAIGAVSAKYVTSFGL